MEKTEKEQENNNNNYDTQIWSVVALGALLVFILVAALYADRTYVQGFCDAKGYETGNYIEKEQGAYKGTYIDCYNESDVPVEKVIDAKGEVFVV